MPIVLPLSTSYRALMTEIPAPCQPKQGTVTCHFEAVTAVGRAFNGSEGQLTRRCTLRNTSCKSCGAGELICFAAIK